MSFSCPRASLCLCVGLYSMLSCFFLCCANKSLECLHVFVLNTRCALLGEGKGIALFFLELKLLKSIGQRFSIPVLAPPRSAYFACLSLLTHLIQIISLLEVRSVHELCSDWHAPYTAPYTVSIAPYTGSIAPYTGSIAHYTVSIAPYTGSIAPYTGSIAPYTGSIAPYTVSIAPYTGSVAPYTGSIAPYTGSVAPYTGSIAPYSLSREIRWSLLHFRIFIHGFALRDVFTHGRVWHHIPL